MNTLTISQINAARSHILQNVNVTPEDKQTIRAVFDRVLANMQADIVMKTGPVPGSWEFEIDGRNGVVHSRARGFNIFWEAARKGGVADISDFSAEGQKCPYDTIRTSIHTTCANHVRKISPELESYFKAVVVNKDPGQVILPGGRNIIVD